MSNEAARRICSQAVTPAVVFAAPGARLAPCEGTNSLKIAHVWDSCKFWQFDELFCCNDDDLENLIRKNLVPWHLPSTGTTKHDINATKVANCRGGGVVGRNIYTYICMKHILHRLCAFIFQNIGKWIFTFLFCVISSNTFKKKTCHFGLYCS